MQRSLIVIFREIYERVYLCLSVFICVYLCLSVFICGYLWLVFRCGECIFIDFEEIWEIMLDEVSYSCYNEV